MDQAAKDRIQHEIEDEVRSSSGARCAGSSGSRTTTTRTIEPGELLPSLILTEPPGRRRAARARRGIQEIPERPRPGTQAVPARAGTAVAEIQHLGFGFEDASGHSRGGSRHGPRRPGEAAESDITHVMVRLKAPELEIVDTLITAGIANSRAEAIRWALARISERPAYAQLREHTRDIQRLTTEFCPGRRNSCQATP